MSSVCRDSEQDRLSLALSSAEMGTWDWDVPAASMWWDERMDGLFGLAPGTFKGGATTFLNSSTKKIGRGFVENSSARLQLAPPWNLAFGRKQASGEDGLHVVTGD